MQSPTRHDDGERSRQHTDGRSAGVVPDVDDVGLVVAGRPAGVGGETGSLPRAGREARSRRRDGTIQGVVLVEIVNRDVALREVSNRVDNNAVRPNNKDRSMGWFGTKPIMKLTNRHG